MNPKRGFFARHTLILAVGLLVLPGAFFQWVFCNPRLDLPRWRRSPPSKPGFMAYLQKVCSDPLVRALFGHLFSQTSHFVGSFCDIFRTLDERSLVPAGAPHQAGHLGHQQGHALGRRNDVVPLEEKKSRRDRSGPQRQPRSGAVPLLLDKKQNRTVTQRPRVKLSPSSVTTSFSQEGRG